MRTNLCQIVTLCGLASAAVGAACLNHSQYDIRPFHIDLMQDVPHMLDLIKRTNLPTEPVYPGLTSDFGIPLDTLIGLKSQWTSSFNWQREQATMNKFHHYMVNIEGVDVHFIHEKSKDPNAIPLILFHGWPGSFLEFVPLINNLTQTAETSTGKTVTFDVIVPSLPGFIFSSTPPSNWTNTDTARIFNTLMADVLGYPKYAVHGTDWGSAIAYDLYNRFNTTTRASHFAFLPFYPLDPGQLSAANISLNSLEEFEEQKFLSWSDTGNGYFVEQSTKPNTLGLAIQDNPVGQLAWLSEKFIDWSDPRAGSTPSVLDHNEILRSVSLYYLTKSITSSMFIYAKNPNGFSTEYTKANTDAPLLYSSFKYNVGFWPPALVELVGNLALYRNHDFGGHFAGLDNPPALLGDLREIETYWTR